MSVRAISRHLDKSFCGVFFGLFQARDQTVESKTFSGGCLCGCTGFTVHSRPRRFYFCHCQQCRKLNGSAFAANVILEPAEITWLSGEHLVKRFDYPGERQFSRVFCTECGSALPFINEAGDSLLIPAGSLDHDPGLLPDTNIFWEDRAAWYEAGVSSSHCAGFPE